jgi:hypothetical protein
MDSAPMPRPPNKRELIRFGPVHARAARDRLRSEPLRMSLVSTPRRVCARATRPPSRSFLWLEFFTRLIMGFALRSTIAGN